jgi:hypothetical protein
MIESRLSSIEAGINKRDDQIASIMHTLTRIEMLLGGTMGSEGLVAKVESTHAKILWGTGFGAALGFLAEYFLGRFKP